MPGAKKLGLQTNKGQTCRDFCSLRYNRILVKGFVMLRLMTALLTAGAMTSAATLNAETFCPTCDDVLTLSSDEWDCLLDELGFYLSVPTQPVFVSLFGCNENDVIVDSTRGDSFNLTMNGDSGEDYSTAFRLMHAQLECLNTNITALRKAKPVSFDFLAECSGPASQEN